MTQKEAFIKNWGDKHGQWWSEISPMWPGQALSLQVEEVLMDKQSDFQHVLVFKSKAWGNVFCLDGALQLCDKDECSYHENMGHIACFSHPSPKKVLIIGGGDGGVQREVLKHETVERVDLCDVDKAVPEMSKQFFPKISCSFDDPRANLHIGDGFEFLKDKQGQYDVIIVDSSDPEGPASTLFGKEFFDRCKAALTQGGILCTQAENMWIHLKLISGMYKFIKDVGFNSVEYCCIQTPSYPSGSIGFFLCSQAGSCAKPVREVPEKIQKDLRYYNADMHRAAFALPQFVKKELGMIE